MGRFTKKELGTRFSPSKGEGFRLPSQTLDLKSNGSIIQGGTPDERRAISFAESQLTADEIREIRRKNLKKLRGKTKKKAIKKLRPRPKNLFDIGGFFR